LPINPKAIHSEASMKTPNSKAGGYQKNLLMRGFRFRLFTAWVTAVVLCDSSALGAQRQVLKGHLPPAVAARKALTIPAPKELDLAFALPLRNREKLASLLQDLYNPASPNYHTYLTPVQFAASFGPAQTDYDAVVQFARSNGMAVMTAYPNRTVLVVRGAVADIEKALHLKIEVYQHPTEARTFYAPDTEPSVDLDVALEGVWGLDSYFLARPGGEPITGGVPAGAPPGGGSGSGGTYRGDDIRPAYVPGTSLTGSGQVIGLFELDGYYGNDIVAYENASGISPLVPLVNVLVDGFSGTPGGNANAVGEVSLDIELAIAMAPGISQMRVYEAANNGAHILSLLNRIASDNLAKQISSSWFIFNYPGSDAVYQQFAAQGQSFFQCSGDLNAFFPGIGQWADNPYITTCGGTFLNTTGPGGAWVSETVWNNGNGTNGTGGGISVNYSIPLWQQGISMASNQGSTSQRNVPDVAMLAYGAWIVSNNGSIGSWWGTSLAAPLWAGYTALVNQQAANHGLPTIGFLNPALYEIAKGSSYGSCFHDVTSGNNTSVSSPSQFYAVAGYDLCTGLGTPNGMNLINALMPYTGYSSGVWVDYNYTGGIQNGTYDAPYKTFAQAVAAVSSGGEVWFRTSGSKVETMTVTKPMTIHALDGPATVGH
jgi:subtilase family serine protease